MITVVEESIVPHRWEGLKRLAVFEAVMGLDYQRTRNYDYGPTNRSNVSMLSPYVTCRLLLEEELVSAALACHSYQAAEKFIDEVFWRSYWKGWLEFKPNVWTEYQLAVRAEKFQLSNNPELHKRYLLACSGSTEYDCFNAWVKELRSVGYLHNHARMWFASIWIYYLALPWQLGADLFLQYLLDGDPASNTLGWRWVAGQQSIGKQYLLQASNIRKYTEGRFDPPDFGEKVVRAFEAPSIFFERICKEDNIPNRPLVGDEPIVLLVHDEDLYLESSPFAECRVSRLVGLSRELLGDLSQVSEQVARFKEGALVDGMTRAAHHFCVNSEIVSTLPALFSILNDGERNAKCVAIMKPRVGPWRSFLAAIMGDNAELRDGVHQRERRWDSVVYPFASSGFFPLKRRIPRLLAELGHGGRI